MAIVELLEQKTHPSLEKMRCWAQPLRELNDLSVRDSFKITPTPPESIINIPESCAVFDWKVARKDSELFLMIKTPLKQYVEGLERGDAINLIFTNCRGVHSFQTTLHSSEAKNLFYDLCLTEPQNYKKLERREYFRLPVQLPTTFKLLRYKNIDLTFNHKEGQGLLSDISAGGLLFQSNLTLPAETYLEFSFLLPQEGIVMVTGKVVRNTQKGDETFYGIQFVDVDPETKGQISRFVFTHEQRSKDYL